MMTANSENNSVQKSTMESSQLMELFPSEHFVS